MRTALKAKVKGKTGSAIGAGGHPGLKVVSTAPAGRVAPGPPGPRLCRPQLVEEAADSNLTGKLVPRSAEPELPCLVSCSICRWF